MPADPDITRPVSQGAQLTDGIQQRQSGGFQLKQLRQGFQFTVLQMGAELRQDLILQITADHIPRGLFIRKQFRKGNPVSVPQIRRARGPHMR